MPIYTSTDMLATLTRLSSKHGGFVVVCWAVPKQQPTAALKQRHRT